MVKENLSCFRDFSIRTKLSSSYGFLQDKEQPEITWGKVRIVEGMLHNFSVKPNAKLNANVLLNFLIFFFFFFAIRTTRYLTRTVSVLKCKNPAIHHTMFVLLLNDA